MKEEIEKEYRRLVEKAKDCGVAHGIYSKKYAAAIHEMNEYWKIHQTRTTRELYTETKNKVKRWILRSY